MRVWIALLALVGGCNAVGLPLETSSRCAWSLSSPVQVSGSTNITWPGGLPTDGVPRCNPITGNGYAASIGIYGPPVLMTLSLQEGVSDVATWQDFTLGDCQSWRNGSAFVSIDGDDVSAHVVADCTTADVHVDATVRYRVTPVQ